MAIKSSELVKQLAIEILPVEDVDRIAHSCTGVCVSTDPVSDFRLLPKKRWQNKFSSTFTDSAIADFKLFMWSSRDMMINPTNDSNQRDSLTISFESNPSGGADLISMVMHTPLADGEGRPTRLTFLLRIEDAKYDKYASLLQNNPLLGYGLLTKFFPELIQGEVELQRYRELILEEKTALLQNGLVHLPIKKIVVKDIRSQPTIPFKSVEIN